MLIGRLDKRIILQAREKVSGVQTWVDKATLWAEFKTPSAKMIELAGGNTSELMREIGIRYRTDVRKGWRVVWDGRNFDVQHVYHYSKSSTVMICREVI